MGLIVVGNKSSNKVRLNLRFRHGEIRLTKGAEQDNQVDESGMHGDSFGGSSRCDDHACCCER